MGLLDDGLPRSVRVGGSEVPIRCGFRSALRSYRLDAGQPAGARSMICMWFGGEGRDLDGCPAEVLADPAGALLAALEWRDGAFGIVSYGKARRSRRRTFDFEADAGIVAADFQRLYGIDLLDPSTQVHWWRFAALLLSAQRTEGSLCAAAISARCERPAAKSAEARRARAELAAAWELPPSEAEAMERARALMAAGARRSG